MGKGTLTIWRIHLTLRALIQRFLTLLSHDNRIHKARFARTYELTRLLSPNPRPGTLLIATNKQGDFVSIAPTMIGHRFDPLHNASTEDQFFSAGPHLLFQPNEGEGRIFTDRAILMLTQMLLAARLENFNPFPYVRHLIRLGLKDTAARLNTVSPDLATQFLGEKLILADLKDRFLLSSWGTLTARMRPLLTEILIRSLTIPVLPRRR